MGIVFVYKEVEKVRMDEGFGWMFEDLSCIFWTITNLANVNVRGVRNKQRVCFLTA